MPSVTPKSVNELDILEVAISQNEALSAEESKVLLNIEAKTLNEVDEVNDIMLKK